VSLWPSAVDKSMNPRGSSISMNVVGALAPIGILVAVIGANAAGMHV